MSAWQQKQVERQARFWELIRQGKTNTAACEAVGVERRQGYRWRKATGGRIPLAPRVVSGRFLSLEERLAIADLRRAGTGVRAIATELGRSPSTISRELTRNQSTAAAPRQRRPLPVYAPYAAHKRAELRGRRPKPSKLEHRPLAAFVHAKMDLKWSPQQISDELASTYVGQVEMRAVRVAEVDVQPGRHGDVAVPGELGAAVPGQRAAQLLGQGADGRDHGVADCGSAVPAGQMHQQYESGAALDQGADRGAAVRAQDQVALPVPGHGSVVGFSRAFADRDDVGEGGLACGGAAPRSAHRPAGPQLLVQVSAQMPAALDVQRLVDRLVGHPLAAGQQREHQRTPAPVLSKRHRPIDPQPRRTRSRGRRTQQPTKKNTERTNSCRGNASAIVEQSRCDDRLKPPRLSGTADAAAEACRRRSPTWAAGSNLLSRSTPPTPCVRHRRP